MNVKINSTGGLSVGDSTNGYKDLATKEYVDNKTFTVSWNDVSGKPTTFTPSSHNHSAGDINSGTLDLARIPTGTTSSTVALGNHTHSNYVDTTNKQSVSGVKKFKSVYVGTRSIDAITGNSDLDDAPGFAAVLETSTSYYTQFIDTSGGYVYVYNDDCGQFYYKPATGAEVTLNLPKTNGTLATQEWVSGNYALASAIAPAYDSTKTYSVGDAVTTNGSLWKCTTAVTTAEAFDSTKWQNVSLLREMLCDIVYPVGSIYTSVNSTSPATLFGGTWERITGKFLLAATDGGAEGGNGSASIAPGYSGGEATHAITTGEMAAHTHGSKTLTGSFESRRFGSSGTPIDVIGLSKTSGICSEADATWSGSHSVISAAQRSMTNPVNDKITITATHTHDSVGSGTAHNNMPPYLAVYVWKRTA